MKKILIIISCIFILLGCQKKEIETIIDRVSTIETIDYLKLKEKLETDTDFIIYIGRADCGDCKQFYPYLEEYVNQTNHGLYYVNIQEFRDSARKEEASNEEKEFYENLKKRLGYNWTPTLQRYKNGEKIAEYQFLDLEYYDIEDKDKQQEKFNEFVENFKTWMNENY